MTLEFCHPADLQETCQVVCSGPIAESRAGPIRIQPLAGASAWEYKLNHPLPA